MINNRKITVTVAVITIMMIALAAAGIQKAHASGYPRSRLRSASVIHESRKKAVITATAVKPAGKYSHFSFYLYDKSANRGYIRTSVSNKYRFRVDRKSRDSHWLVYVTVVYDKYGREVAPVSSPRSVKVKKRAK